MGRRGWGLLAVIGGLIALGVAGYVYSSTRTPAAAFRTAKVDRGLLVATVSATGNLNAVTTVQVGSQVSGQVRDVLVDFNSTVRRGQLIARIDPEVFQAKLNAAQADLDSAQAQVLNQRANVEKVRADLENARAAVTTAEANIERVRADVENARAMIASAQATVAREAATTGNAQVDLERRLDLFRRELISQSDRDLAQTAYDTARAQLEAARAQQRAGEAALRSAQAQLAATQSQARAAQAQVSSSEAALQVAQAQLKAAEASARQRQAALQQSRLDLEHTEIRAPVDGVVVARSVDPGQTVAASLQAPTLFTIAQDLTRMQVEAAVDEADVGRLHEGMAATFTVDAFPGRSFRGEITQIRKAAQIVQNVVSYTTVVAVPNPERILLPGMTANVRIQVDRREGALRVANAALRFRPAGEAAEAPGSRRAGGAGTTPPATAPATPPSGSTSGGDSARAGLRDMRETLVRELALTADQQAKLDAILAEARQSLAGLRGQGADEQGREARRRRMREEIREKIRAILTPDQQKRYEALASSERAAGGQGSPGTQARVYVLDPDGKPRAVAIVVGISDGTMSEVLGGDLQAGQEVLVGTAAAGTRPTGGSSGPRLRL